jgi:hypothetical protein
MAGRLRGEEGFEYPGRDSIPGLSPKQRNHRGHAAHRERDMPPLGRCDQYHLRARASVSVIRGVDRDPIMLFFTILAYRIRI